MGTIQEAVPVHRTMGKKQYLPASAETVHYEVLDEEQGALRSHSSYQGGFRDPIYAVLFILDLVVLAVLAAAFHRNTDNIDPSTSAGASSFTIGDPVLYGVLTAIGAAIFFSFIWLLMMRTCAKNMIWAGMIF